MKFSAWLEGSGLSQSELARALGVTQGRISQVLAGAKPSFDLANRIRTLTRNKVRPEDFAETALSAEGLDSVEDAIAAIAKGEMVVVVDDDDRENEGDLIGAAS